MSSNDKKLAVVTGGNRGLGLETCRQLAQRGLRVVLTSRDPDKGERATARLVDEGLDVVFAPLDVTDRDSIASAAKRVGAEWGPVDALVNNAGVSFDGFNPDVARKTVEVNFFGAMRVTDAFLPQLAKGANIVMVSSGMGELASLSGELKRRLLDPNLSREELVTLMNGFVSGVGRGRHREAGWPGNAYRVSKIGLNALTRVLDRELAGSAIRVNAVSPGWVRTDMGGSHAPRSVEEGADTIVWAATLGPDGPSGGFFSDRKPRRW